jgi:predicted phage tail protein
MNVDGSALVNIAGYRISYGSSASSLTQSVQASGATTTSASINGLAAGTYYFSVAAVNSSGESSAPTNVVSIAVP